MAEKPNFGQKLFEGLAQGWNNYAIDRQKQQDVKRDNAGQALQFALKKQQMDAENQQRTMANQKLNLEIMKLTTDMHKTPEQRAQEKAEEQRALLQTNLDFATQNQGQLQTLGQAGLEIPGMNFNPPTKGSNDVGGGLTGEAKNIFLTFGPDAVVDYLNEQKLSPYVGKEQYQRYTEDVTTRNQRLADKNAVTQANNQTNMNFRNLATQQGADPQQLNALYPVSDTVPHLPILPYGDWRNKQINTLGLTPFGGQQQQVDQPGQYPFQTDIATQTDNGGTLEDELLKRGYVQDKNGKWTKKK